MPLVDLVAKIGVDDEMKKIFAEILPTREPLAQTNCRGRRCWVRSLGNEHTFRIESIDIPVLGSPIITLGKQIDLILELSEDLSRLEVCRIEGIKAKTGAVNNRVDGLLIEKQGALIKTLRIDVGAGGDYPIKDCV